MKIKMKDAPVTLDTLLTREQTEGFEDSFSEQVCEIFADSSKLSSFGFPDAAIGRGMALAEGVEDTKPEFVIVRTEEGWSNGGRLYGPAIIDSIAEQINATQPVAHLGHIPDHELSTSLPDPQTTWFAAITKMEPSKLASRAGQLVKTIYTAGYLLPQAKIKTFLRANTVNSTSWQGTATQKPIPGKGVEITEFKLASLDWARKGSEGMPTARVVALAREMNATKEGSTSMEKELSQVTPDEFKEANPNGHALLVREAQAEQAKTISEMQAQIEEADADKKLLAELRDVLKAAEGDNLLEKVAHLVKRLGEKAKFAVEKHLDSILEENVKDDRTRSIVRGLMTPQVAEMEAKCADAKDEEEAEKIVREMADTALNSNDLIKSLVSEQTAPIVRRREEIHSGGETSADKAFEATGMKRQRVKMGG